MIGNREITDRQRRAAFASFESNRHLLPNAVAQLVRRVERLNASSDVGFRRRNTAALLATYFFDMKVVFEATLRLLRPGALAHFVVGTNHTTAGGEKVEINTPALLADVAEAVGFEVGNVLPMEMLPSRDIFRANSVAGESIITLRKTQ
jgi:site-specific DNA-methyltransferase (cytosine-N4-specific)